MIEKSNIRVRYLSYDPGFLRTALVLAKNERMQSFCSIVTDSKTTMDILAGIQYNKSKSL